MKIDMVIQDSKKLCEMLSKDQKLTKEEKELIRVGGRILRMVFGNLGRKYSFARLFLDLLLPVPVWDEICLETDGRNLFFSPKSMVKSYREHGLKQVEDHLFHIVLHGILGHFALRDQFQQLDVMDCCMDLEVLQMHLKVEQTEADGLDLSLEERMLLQKLIKGKPLSARKMYFKLTTGCLDEISLAKKQYVKDCHEIWGGNKEYHLCLEISAQELAFERNEANGAWDKMGALAFGPQDNRKDLLQQEMENEAKHWGREASGQEEMYKADSCQGRNYLEVLEELFRYQERFLEQEDSIDKNLYLYGLQEYGNVALIEPEEYKEVPMLSVIVVAIDTSGSCSGNIMSRFLREIGNLFRDVTAKGEFEHIYLLQCDAEIQRVECYHRPEEIPKNMEFSVKGFGGTDFRPVFQWVEEQKKEDVVPDLLLYLSDGYGDYPEKEPEYPVYFVLTEKSKTDMPKWIKKLYL